MLDIGNLLMQMGLSLSNIKSEVYVSVYNPSSLQL